MNFREKNVPVFFNMNSYGIYVKEWELQFRVSQVFSPVGEIT